MLPLGSALELPAAIKHVEHLTKHATLCLDVAAEEIHVVGVLRLDGLGLTVLALVGPADAMGAGLVSSRIVWSTGWA